MEELNKLEEKLLIMMALVQEKKFNHPKLKIVDPELLKENKKRTIELLNRMNGFPIPEKQIIVCTRALEVTRAIKSYMVGKEKYFTVTQAGFKKVKEILTKGE